MDRVLKATAATISVTLYVDSTPTAATGTPTVTITRDSTGAAIVTNAATTPGSTGVYSYTLVPADIPEVDLLTAVWTFTQNSVAGQKITTQVEVVGGFLCSLAEIAASMPNITKTADQMRAARNWAEDWLEQTCGVAFRPRYRRETLSGKGQTDLILAQPLPTSVLSASIDSTALTGADLTGLVTDSLGFIYRANKWTTGRENISIAYVHGYASVPPPVNRAAVKLARHYLLDDATNLDERATSMTTEDATYSFVTAGVRGARSSIPEVNQVIDEYRFVSV